MPASRRQFHTIAWLLTTTGLPSLASRIYRPVPELPEGWEPPARAAYRNLHGIRLPQWEKDR
jgi:hypothetical protein